MKPTINDYSRLRSILKKVEPPVEHIVSGKVVKPSGILLNPGGLDFYYQFARVKEVLKGDRVMRQSEL